MLAFARRRKGKVEWRFKRRFSRPELEGEGKKNLILWAISYRASSFLLKNGCSVKKGALRVMT